MHVCDGSHSGTNIWTIKGREPLFEINNDERLIRIYDEYVVRKFEHGIIYQNKDDMYVCACVCTLCSVGLITLTTTEQYGKRYEQKRVQHSMF